MTASCAHVLGLLEQGPVPFETLRSALHAFLDGAQEHEVLKLLGEIVDTLGKIGLVTAHEDAP